MFEQDVERLEHALDDALLFYYAAQSAEEKESYIQKAVEASLDRLQCCVDAFVCSERIERFPGRLRDYVMVSEYVLNEGILNFVRVGCFSKGGTWSLLTARAMHLQEELLSLDPSVMIGCH